MIRLINITKQYGGTPIFSELSLNIQPGARIGLVGDNGAGKSTLLKILAGDIESSKGEIVTSGKARIGMLRQEIGGDEDVELLSSVTAGATHIVALQTKMDKCSDELHTAEKQKDMAKVEKLAHAFAEAHDLFERAGGYSLDGKARAILGGLGFTPEQFSLPVGSFSGGWRMRQCLAKLLLSNPDLLLLDEPTNHLDLESSIWLESFLTAYEGALVIISHDRFFLNRMVSAIAEIEHARLTLYPYPYDRYLEEKEKRRVLLESASYRQGKEIERQEKFIERFRAKNTKATAVQSRIKALAKVKRIETVKDTRGIGFKFEETIRIGSHPVEVNQAQVAYGDNVVYKSLDFSMRRGDRIALVGPNGAGKSTLIKLISGEVEPKKGKMKLGGSVAMRYFAQHQLESLDLKKTVLEELTAHIPFEAISRARSMLGSFLFRKDDVDKKVEVLSGGEKSRLALAKIALTPTNLLLLDEPTNHLDLKSRQALEKALARFGGCVLFISHDRAFIDAVANKIIHVDNGILTEFLGDWAYYESKRDGLLGKESDPVPASGPKREVAADRKSRKERRIEAARKREAKAELMGPMKKELAKMEKALGKVEERIKVIEAVMGNPATYEDKEKAAKLGKELGDLKKESGKLMSRWERMSFKMESSSEELEEA